MRSVTASFALPFAADDVGLDLRGVQHFERNPRFDKPLANLAVPRLHCNAGEDAMRTAREQAQARARFRLGLGLRQNAAANGDDGVGGEHDGGVCLHRFRFRGRLVFLVVVLLVWVYYSSQTVLLGAEFTRAYVERFGGPRPKVSSHARKDVAPEATGGRADGR